MLTHFPRYFSTRAIICYIVTLALVSTLYLSYAMPIQFIIFGIVAVLVFFVCSNKLTMNWQRFKPELFTRKLFITALVIRVVYVVFIYFYFIENTGEPHAYYAGDELFYQTMGESWRVYGYDEFRSWLRDYVAFSDSGYCWWRA